MPFLGRWQHRTGNISQCQCRAAGQTLSLLPIYALHTFLNFTCKNTFLCLKLNVLSPTVNIVYVTPISRNNKTRRPYECISVTQALSRNHGRRVSVAYVIQHAK